MSEPGPEMVAAASILIFHKAAACASLLPRYPRSDIGDERISGLAFAALRQRQSLAEIGSAISVIWEGLVAQLVRARA